MKIAKVTLFKHCKHEDYLVHIVESITRPLYLRYKKCSAMFV